MGYFQQLLSRACSDTWEFVIDVPARAIIAGVLIFCVTLFLHWKRKGLDDMKDVLFGGLEGALATVIILVAVFVVHFFMLSPKHLVEDANKAREEATREPLPPPVIKLDVTDLEARRELEETKNALQKARETIHSLSPLRQNIASATVSLRIAIVGSNALQGGVMGATAVSAGFGKGSEALIWAVGSSLMKAGEQNENWIYQGEGVATAPEYLGKPILRLLDAEYIQIEVSGNAKKEQMRISGGKVAWVINGIVRLSFDIPDQVSNDGKVYVRNLTDGLNPLRDGGN